MADTRRLAMLKAVESTLNGAGKPAGLNVHRFGFRAIEKDDLPALVVQHGGGVGINREVNDLTENTDVVSIAIQCLGSQVTEPDDLIDPHLSWVISALEADPTLGGVVNQIELRPAGQTEAVEADRVYIRVIQAVEIQYYHRRTNPESQT